jgi:hypothetical protein
MGTWKTPFRDFAESGFPEIIGNGPPGIVVFCVHVKWAIFGNTPIGVVDLGIYFFDLPEF